MCAPIVLSLPLCVSVCVCARVCLKPNTHAGAVRDLGRECDGRLRGGCGGAGGTAHVCDQVFGAQSHAIVVCTVERQRQAPARA